jgi:hypothetical protein
VTSVTSVTSAPTPASSGPLSAIAEYFTLRGALAVHAKLDATARKTIGDTLALGRQKAEGADALWSNGHAAEGLRMAGAALEETATAAVKYARARGLSAAAAPFARDAEKPAASPVIDGGASPAPGASPSSALPAPTSSADAGVDAHADAAPSSSSSIGASTAGGSSAPASSAALSAAAPSSAAPSSAAVSTGAASTPAVATAARPIEEIASLDQLDSDVTLRAAALRERGVPATRIATIESALRALRATSLPTLDAEVSPVHAELFEQVVGARRILDRALSPAGLERRAITWARATRITTVLLTAALVLGVAYLVNRTPEGITAEASAVWASAPAFAASNVIDGRPETWWLLPDRSPGWVEARISPGQRVARVRVLNSHNPPAGDRATRDYQIEIYAGGELAQTIEGSFEHSMNPQPVVHELPTPLEDVERIRFVARSYHQNGAGLADLSWE